MKRIALLLIIVATLGGCTTVKATATNPNGTQYSVFYNYPMWQQKSHKASLDSNGTFDLTCSSSSENLSDSLSAINNIILNAAKMGAVAK